MSSGVRRSRKYRSWSKPTRSGELVSCEAAPTNLLEATFLRLRPYPFNSDMATFLVTYRSTLHMISCEVIHRGGGSIGSKPPRTALGVKAWRRARKPPFVSIPRKDAGERLNVDLGSCEASDVHFQGLGAVRRRGRRPLVELDAVRFDFPAVRSRVLQFRLTLVMLQRSSRVSLLLRNG